MHRVEKYTKLFQTKPGETFCLHFPLLLLAFFLVGAAKEFTQQLRQRNI